MMTRPPAFLPSDVSSKMIGRLRDDHEKVTKQWLPKGNISSVNSTRASNTPGSWPFETASPDSRCASDQLQQLQDVGVVELLEQDERPTFIIDLTNHANFGAGQLALLFANASLRASQKLLDLLSVDTSDPAAGADFSRFKAWVVSFVRHNESADVCLPSLTYGGISWTCSTIRRRFRFVSGNTAAVSLTPTSLPLAQASSVLDQRARGPAPIREPGPSPRERASSDVDYFGNVNRGTDRRSNSVPRDLSNAGPETPVQQGAAPGVEETGVASFDWTRITVTPTLPAHIKFARSVDWAATPAGPVEHWPADLRIMSNLIMGSPHPAAMYWGPEYISIYNESYTSLAGQKHPGMMGMGYRECWAEIWDDIGPVVDCAWHQGQATMKHDDQMMIIRNGYLEETFFNWAIVPLIGGDGSVVALYNPAFENTRRKVNERRMLTLREVGEQTLLAQNAKSFWGLVQKGLEFNEYDVPFALIYAVAEDNESEVSSMHSGGFSNPPQITLEGSIGVPAGHPSAVPAIDLRTSDQGFAPYMRESLSLSGAPVVLSRDSGTLPGRLIDGLEWKGFGDPSRTIVVFPVHPTTAGDTVVGFIVMGTNPRRPYDDDYQLFIHLLSRQLATSMASVVLFEEEIRRGQRAARLAALDRQELSLQLHLRTQEAVESEYKFTRMAEFSPVGMFFTDERGSMSYCNDMWWEISRHPRTHNSADSWMDSVHDEDRHALETVWKRLLHEKVAITHEFRFKWSRTNDKRLLETWALLSAFPQRKESTGELKSIFGCLTDISQQKWAEDFQKQRREEAVELKRQQENFIDITSHEMRNPLSAILQCADEITNSIAGYRSGLACDASRTLNNLLDGCLEASTTISLCANHQVRIANDILTLSKLDSQLLLVTPVDAQPVAVMQNVLKMFETELNANDIRCEFRVEKSYQDLGIDWVKIDPSRLRQVLINLMTNAIKFTQSREERSIVITLGATLNDRHGEGGISYFPGDANGRENLTDGEDWGTGQKINLHIAVTDTGPGLNEQEKAMLFQRFSQASPRTHVQYGGSGLGLFISRILSELQGGRIGVESEKGVGSTFAFYIKSRVVSQSQLSPTTTMPPSPSPFRPPAGGTSAPLIAYATRGSKPTTPTTGLNPAGRRISPPPEPRDPEAPPPLEILIVEDNLVNQKVLQRQLRKWGNNTHVANHGGEALDALRRSQFWNPERRSAADAPHARETSAKSVVLGSRSGRDPGGGREDAIRISVVLMDLEMPVMDGMTCARKIRGLEEDGTILHHVPIIAVTAYARPEQIENAKAAGIVSNPDARREGGSLAC